MQGSINLQRSGAGSNGENLSAEEHRYVFETIGWNSRMGTIVQKNNYQFLHNDERSSEGLTNVADVFFQVELNSKMNNITILDSSLKLHQQSCEEKGFSKKVLICEARYEHMMKVELNLN